MRLGPVTLAWEVCTASPSPAPASERDVVTAAVRWSRPCQPRSLPSFLGLVPLRVSCPLR